MKRLALLTMGLMFLGASSTAEAGLLSGLFGGSKSSCCKPKPSCSKPKPTCCAPKPSCCKPKPTCCAPKPSCSAPAGGKVAPGVPKKPYEETPPVPDKGKTKKGAAKKPAAATKKDAKK